MCFVSSITHFFWIRLDGLEVRDGKNVPPDHSRCTATVPLLLLWVESGWVRLSCMASSALEVTRELLKSEGEEMGGRGGVWRGARNQEREAGSLSLCSFPMSFA